MPRAQTTTDDGCMRDFSPLPKHPRPRRAELRRRQDLPPVRTAASLASVVRCARHRHRPTATRELFSGPRRTVRNSLRETSGTGWANWVSRSRPVRRRCFPEEGRSGIAWVSRELTPPLLNEAAALFEDGQTVREVAAVLRISKSEAGRLRQRAVEEGLLARNGGTEEQSSIIRLVPRSPTVGE
jgi:hypothetical protein